MRRLYFNHISKTAGMALISLLEMHVPRELVCPADTIDDLFSMSTKELEHYVLFRGPFGNVLAGRLPEPPIKVTMLRDPIERSISHFLMTARTRPSRVHPFSEFASRLTFSEAIVHRYFRPIFSNFQARYLTLRFTDEVKSWIPPVDPDHPFIEQVRADYFPFDTNDLQVRALSALLDYDVIGVSEYIWQCYEQICQLMEWQGRVELRHRNTGDARLALSGLADMSPGEFEALLAMNTVDMRLYEVAKHTARTAAVPVGVP